MPTSTFRLATAGLLLVAAVAACGGAAASTAPATTVPTESATTAAESAPASAGSSSPVASADAAASATGTSTVNANSASTDELVAALTAAGVPNPDRWTREIEEYRPYPTDDPTLQKLQDNLAKYNPDPATLAGILSALQP
ncbi:MAG TPA: hypothetical protein VGK16_13190 [Candidatus Limnocylindrales bacterium]|jgi:hypothetical protein